MSGNTKSKNRQSILLGGIIGIIAGFFLSELIQGLIAYLLGAADFRFSISITGLVCSFKFSGIVSIWLEAFVYLFPILFAVSLYEIGMMILRRSEIGSLRYSAIIFEIIITGYIIIHVFYGAASVIFQLHDNDWVSLIALTDFGFEGEIVFMFIVIILLSVYLNFATKRINKFIHV